MWIDREIDVKGEAEEETAEADQTSCLSQREQGNPESGNKMEQNDLERDGGDPETWGEQTGQEKEANHTVATTPLNRIYNLGDKNPHDNMHVLYIYAKSWFGDWRLIIGNPPTGAVSVAGFILSMSVSSTHQL